MQVPPEVALRGVSRSPALDRAIVDGIAELEGLDQGIITCRIAVELPHRRKKHGNLFRVRVDLTVPGAEIVASRLPPEHTANEDVVAAVSEAFDTARLLLLEHARKRRDGLRPVEPPPRARVAQLFHGEDYGFLESVDGRELYFHRNSVQGRGFDALEVGHAVRFAEEMGEKGPQATAVIPLD